MTPEEAFTLGRDSGKEIISTKAIITELLGLQPPKINMISINIEESSNDA